MAATDLRNRRFGRLVAIKRDLPNPLYTSRSALWVCKCDCGRIITIRSNSLVEGRSRSCGCLMLEIVTKHGHTKSNGYRSPEYWSWFAMRQRCDNPHNKDYDAYGGNEITYPKRWQKFKNFLADMGPRPPGTSLDRYPKRRGNYGPNNCRWATAIQQRSGQLRRK